MDLKGYIQTDETGNLFIFTDDESFPIGNKHIEFFDLREGSHVEFRVTNYVYPTILRKLGGK